VDKVKELKSIEEWNQLKNESQSKSDMVIFKYSPYCSISAFAEENFNSWISSLSDREDLRIIKVNVVSERPVSQQIAKDLKVVHESPQLIWVDTNLSVKWNATHYNITETALNDKIKIE